MVDWAPERSAELYGIPRWGGGYFDVSDAGHLCVRPHGPQGPAVDLFGLVGELRRRGHPTPLVIRFSDLLERRVQDLSAAFERARSELGYTGQHRMVYPLKVNQQRQVVEELVESGRACRLGLEAGSKAELLVALAMLDNPEGLIVCNGYKDRGYLETALLAQRLGRHPVIVLDRPHELEILLKVSGELGIRPHVGVRTRLSARGAGKWSDSTGDRSKFGLAASEIVELVRRLRSADLLDRLEMLHFHIGSQITDIRAHQEALREATRVLVGLARLGARIAHLNVGGGLGIDYDGSQSSRESSINYSEAEYARDVVATTAEACSAAGIPAPDLVTEAGRALVAHASILAFDVLDVDQVPGAELPQPALPDEHKVIRELGQVLEGIEPARVRQAHHRAVALKEEATSLFTLGYLDLEQRARAEALFWSCERAIAHALREVERVPEELRGIERELADIYYGNFSVFQSIPDSWAVGQLFPIVPLHRLDEEPTRRGVLVDLTCDSDGRVDRFIGAEAPAGVLPLHAPDGRRYELGVFLVGAYQETLGELHNLFGDTAVVHVQVDADGGYRIDRILEAESVERVLGFCDFERPALTERVRQAIEVALRERAITLEESALLRRRYAEALAGFTYLERED
ncbi:MAG: biosynthetic arginine decarboxylase [Myxococcota bacterium]